jgi:hypothetical protein
MTERKKKYIDCAGLTLPNTEKGRDEMYLRIDQPYLVMWDEKTFFFLNRHYKNLGNSHREYIQFPDLKENSNCLHFYYDGNKPWDSKKKREEYLERVAKWQRDIRDKHDLKNEMFWLNVEITMSESKKKRDQKKKDKEK